MTVFRFPIHSVIFDLTNSDEEKIIKLEETPSYNAQETLTEHNLASSSKEVEEKEDHLTQ